VAEISGTMYIIIGFFVAVASLIVNMIDKESNFTLFAIVGGLFLIWGLIKVLRNRKKSDEAHDNHLRGIHQKKKVTSPHQKTVQGIHNPHTKTQKNHPYVAPRYCPKCGNQMNHYDNFCSNCGFRVR